MCFAFVLLAGGALDNHENTCHTQESCQEAVSHFTKHSPRGGLDVLFNCAGMLVNGPFAEAPLPKTLAQIHVNLTGLVTLTHAALPHLRITAQATATDGAAPLPGRTRVVNMCSTASMHGIPFEGVYSATKAGVRAVTEAWALEWEHDKSGVGSFDVTVPLVRTPMLMNQDASGNANIVGMAADDAWISPESVTEVVWEACHADPGETVHVYHTTWEKTYQQVNFLRTFFGDRAAMGIIRAGCIIPDAAT